MTIPVLVTDPQTGEVEKEQLQQVLEDSGLIVYDPDSASNFSVALARGGVTKEDLILLKASERQEAIRLIAAQGLGYETPDDVMVNAPNAVLDEWRFLCGRIAMVDADVAEEVAVKFLYDAWIEDPTRERLIEVLDHSLSESNQGRYFKITKLDNGNTTIKPQPPFYMLLGFFGAVYEGKMTLDEVIKVFERDIDWQSGSVRKAAETYGGGVATTMKERAVQIKRLKRALERAEDPEDQGEIQAKFEEIETKADQRIEKLGELYEKSRWMRTKEMKRKKDEILGRKKKQSGPPRLSPGAIQVVERVIAIPPGLPEQGRMGDKIVKFGGYRELKLLFPLAEDGTDLSVSGSGYIAKLLSLIEEYKGYKGEE